MMSQIPLVLLAVSSAARSQCPVPVHTAIHIVLFLQDKAAEATKQKEDKRKNLTYAAKRHRNITFRGPANLMPLS
jgi:hypothetical protein